MPNGSCFLCERACCLSSFIGLIGPTRAGNQTLTLQPTGQLNCALAVECQQRLDLTRAPSIAPRAHVNSLCTHLRLSVCGVRTLGQSNRRVPSGQSRRLRQPLWPSCYFNSGGVARDMAGGCPENELIPLQGHRALKGEQILKPSLWCHQRQ